ncbi:MAG: UPF0182 family protein, partial [Thermodesulfobacteriota bacterium]|nr:UPF0182 family protein [Thermodesulfobacteriota bacterium]
MKIKLIIGLGFLALVLLWSLVSIYPDWLWFESLDFSPVFWTMLLSKSGFGLVVWLILILLVSLNLYAARRLNPGKGPEMVHQGKDVYLGLSSRALNSLLIAFIVILSFVVASKGSNRWDLVLRYLYQQPFGGADPVFNKDIAFYVFSLPFYAFVREGLLVLFVMAGLVTICWYLKDGALQIEGEFVQSEGIPTSLPRITISQNAKKHLAFLGGIIVLLVACGYQLRIYGLLYSTQGPAFGASYTDIHMKVLAFRILIVISLGLALVLFLNAFKFRKKLVWMAIGIWAGSVLLFTAALPL